MRDLSKSEALEFIQLPDVQIQPIIVDIAKKSIEGKYPMSEGLGFPIRNVASRRFKHLIPVAIESTVAGTIAEKAEAPIANLGAPSTEEDTIIKYGTKEMVTREAIEDAGWNVIPWVITRLSQRVHLPIERDVINAMLASGALTAPAQATWDSATTYITNDILNARNELVRRGFPWNTHQLIVNPRNFKDMVVFFEGKGYLTEGVGRDTPLAPAVVAKIVDMPVIIEPCQIDTTLILDDNAIVHARDPDYGCLWQRSALKSRTWEDDAIEGARWIELSREILADRIVAESVFVISNTTT